MSEPSSKLLTDASTRAEVSRDMGGILCQQPLAVLRPDSAEDVVEAIRWCNRRKLPVTARGQGHTAFGQAQVVGGVVVDMRSLRRIHAFGPDRVTVDAGLTWRELLAATVARRQTPPVLTAFQGLSVGGTLSVGGLSGAAYKRGAQIDHVLSLEVVTGDGALVTCSHEIEPELYEAVLGGLGRCGIIVRATLRLVPAPNWVHHTRAAYADHRLFLDDLARLARREELDGLSGTIYPDTPQGPRYELNAFTFDEPRDTARLERAVAELASRREGVDAYEYERFYLQVDDLIDGLQARWHEAAHPWFDMFLPETALDTWLAQTISQLGPEDVGPPELGALGQAHLFPVKRSCLKHPLLRVPNSEWVYLFDILSASHGRADSAYVARTLGRNRLLYERARALGGTLYPIGAIPLGPEDWSAHWGDATSALAASKRRWDPGEILPALTRSDEQGAVRVAR